MATKKDKVEQVQATHSNVSETGIVALDLVLGGGLPWGKVIELNSDSGVGKTSLSLYLASRLARQGKKVYYIDIERGVDNGIMKNMGLLEHLGMVYKSADDKLDFNGKNFILDQKTSLFSELQAVVDWGLGKNAKDRTRKPIRHENTPDLIVLDSLAMLVPDASKEKTIDSNVSNNMIAARYITQMFKDMAGDLFETGTTLLFINHTQTKMKKLGFNMQQAYQDSAGSSMVKYGTDIRLYMDKSKELVHRRKTIVGEQECRIGSTAEIYTKKSRVEDNGIRLPIKLIDAFGVFNGYTLKPVCENLGWIEGTSGHYYVKESSIMPKDAKVTEKGLYINGSDAVEIFCQQNANIIVQALKQQGLYRVTLDRLHHSNMLEVITGTLGAKK